MKGKNNNIGLFKKIYNLIRIIQKGSCDRKIVAWTKQKIELDIKEIIKKFTVVDKKSTEKKILSLALTFQMIWKPFIILTVP